MNPSDLASWANAAFEAGLVYVLLHERLRYKKEQELVRSRIAVNLEVVDPNTNKKTVFGKQHLIDSVADIIDRLRDPKTYAGIDPGNEILIVGPQQAGKKLLAFEMARAAKIKRVIIVHDPHDVDTLAHAKKLIEKKPPIVRRLWRAAARKTTLPASDMLLLPNLNNVNGHIGEAWRDQLEALIEAAASPSNVLVVGTTEHYERTGDVASWFGAVLKLPELKSGEWHEMTRNIAQGFWETAQQAGFALKDLQQNHFIETILEREPTPAEIEDIFMHCRTQAVYSHKQKNTSDLVITKDMLDHAIERAMPAEPQSPTRAVLSALQGVAP
jgi:hypothetical protein